MSQALQRSRPTQRAAGYIGGGGRERCAECRFFMPASTCTRIQGPVSPRGWCRYYSRELSVLRYTPQGAGVVGVGATLDLDFTAGALDPRIAFTRASTGTYFDATGVMRTAPMNLWLQSADASNAAWGTGVPATGNQVTAPDGTMTAARVVYPAVSGAGTFANLGQTIAGTVSPYAFSVWMRGSVGGEQLYLMATPDAALWYRTLCTLTTAWQRFTLVTANLTAVSWFFQIGTDLRDAGQTSKPAQTVYMWGGQVERGSASTTYAPTTTVPNGAPRFDYDPVTHALRGLLIEEARTNMEANSASLATWSALQTTLTGAAGIAPDGTNSMRKLAEDASNNFHTLIATYSITGTSAYTFSVFAKAVERQFLIVGFDDGVSNGVFLNADLVAGTFTSQATGTATLNGATMQPVGGGIYRCSISGTIGGTTGRMALTLYNAAGNGGFPPYQGVAGRGVLLWGAQLEQGAFPTSYIPTAGAAVTRAQDSCTIASANMSPWFVSPGGSWQAEFIYFNPASALTPRIISGPAAASSYTMALYTGLQLVQYDGIGFIFTAALSNPNVVVKGATTWAPGGANVCLNGGVVASTAAMTAGFAFLGTGGIRLGANSAAGDGMSGCIRRVRYWPRVLSNAEMQAVTT